MLNVNNLHNYYPRNHGEHGVDATLHSILKETQQIHEAYCNPPGGSWAELDITHPQTNDTYRWDHIPRVAKKAKRPDLIMQYNNDNEINLLLIESKKQISDYYQNMKNLMIQYFTGSEDFNGLINRPAWHVKRVDTDEWIFLNQESANEERLWFKKFNINSPANFFVGFSYALTPEYYENLTDVDIESIEQEQSDLTSSEEIDFLIGIGWYSRVHNPFAVITYDDPFRPTEFGKTLSELLTKIEYSTILGTRTTS